MAQEPLHHWTRTGNTGHTHPGVHVDYSGRDLLRLAGKYVHRVGTQGMGRALREGGGEKEKGKKRDSGS
jgi:hypothetical protein